MYTLRYTPQAVRGINAIPRGIAANVTAAIRALAYDPRPPGCQQFGENRYRISEWGYIIEYEIREREVVITVLFIG
jgi:mRNA interferase RelE/StbE